MKKWTKSWAKGAEKLLGRAGQLPAKLAQVDSRELPKRISQHVPSRRQRRRLVKSLRRDVERLSGVASGLSSLLGVAAAGSELLSVLRRRDEEPPPESYDDSSADEADEEVDADGSGDEEEEAAPDEDEKENREGEVDAAEDQEEGSEDDQSEVRMRRAS